MGCPQAERLYADAPCLKSRPGRSRSLTHRSNPSEARGTLSTLNVPATRSLLQQIEGISVGLNPDADKRRPFIDHKKTYFAPRFEFAWRPFGTKNPSTRRDQCDPLLPEERFRRGGLQSDLRRLPITTIRQPCLDIGAGALSMMLDRISHVRSGRNSGAIARMGSGARSLKG